MGLTDKGYVRRTYNDIVEAKIQKAKELFGEDIETNEQTPLGKFIRINAYDQAKIEEEAELIYYSRFPNTASGVSLDRLCVFVGITRNPATAARYLVKIIGEYGGEIPVGFTVGTESGLVFYATNIGEIYIAQHDEETGEYYELVEVECTTRGTIGNVDPSEITEIIETSAAITSVVGTKVELLGEDEESDYSLRSRFEAARDGQGSCNESSIVAALCRIDDVKDAVIDVYYELDPNRPDVDAHTFECSVYVEDNRLKEDKDFKEAVAKTIFEKKPIGIGTYGSEFVNFKDDYGDTQYNIRFSFVQNTDVSVNVKIKTTSSFKQDGKEQIKKNIADYINSLDIDSDVIYSSMFGLVHSVDGIADVTSIGLSNDGGATFVSSNLEITQYEGNHYKARCSIADITVEVIE